MRLDHLLSKEEEVEIGLLSRCQGVLGRKQDKIEDINLSGGDAFRGHTRSHPEHDG